MSMTRHRIWSHGGEQGSALVELALVLPIVMALLLGVVTGGISYNRKISMTNAVREATRFGATLDDTNSWGPSVAARVKDLAPSELETTQICVELVRAPSTVLHSEPTSCPFAGKPADPTDSSGKCLVKVWVQRQSKLEAFFYSKTLTLTAAAVNRFERICL